MDKAISKLAEIESISYPANLFHFDFSFDGVVPIKEFHFVVISPHTGSDPFFDSSDGIKLLFDKNPKTLPLVSIIIRTLGKKPLLAQAMDCVTHQTYPNIEVVVVEDGPPTLETFLKSYPFYVDNLVPI